MVTWGGLLAHGPIAYLIATNRLVAAGGLLVVFGLFDTLDGELARLQGRVSDLGGFLDASTDRLKEVLLYSGATYLLATTQEARWAVVPTLALGMSLCVSYVKAKGEAAVAAAGVNLPYAELNRLFGGGLFPFEVRMSMLAAGLFTGQVGWAAAMTAACSLITVLQRLYVIGRRLQA